MPQEFYSQELIDGLNKDIKQFPVVHKITKMMETTYKGISRVVMLDRYAFKDTEKLTLKVGDFVVLTAQADPKFPVRGLGTIKEINKEKRQATVQLEEEFWGALKDPKEAENGLIVRSLDVIDKPMELFYEQIAGRNATGLASVEKTKAKREAAYKRHYNILINKQLIPAGRVLYGAGSGTDVTYFNCYVMPYPQDSRGGIAEHRKAVMEIMSRGGGVGTNGSTLRPRGAIAKSVNGKASGAVSWLDDIAKLTHLVEQGGSRRGAQMIMLADWHPDILEFIISKMQNPKILRFIAESGEFKDEDIVRLAKDKLKFTPFKAEEKELYEDYVAIHDRLGATESTKYKLAKQKLSDGGLYSVHNTEFLTGANISVCLTKEFMDAIENGEEYTLKFPHTESYDEAEMEAYNENWHKVGDVREWEELGFAVKEYKKIDAKELWNLVNFCATYSAEPGIFFLDNANEMTNAKAYGQKVVATNPCGEQPLAPWSVCNLAAINLAEVADKEKKEVDYELLKQIVADAIHLQDNVISATPYFLEANQKQALGERRIGLGVMGLHDLLIYCEAEYGSEKGNAIVDKVFETIKLAAYRQSIELAKEKGSFPFLDEGDIEENRKAFINTGFMKKMPEGIRQDILKYGIRNSHLLTVAPTGSTGTMVGVSTGLEPYFSFSYFRSGRLGKFIEVKADIVQEYLDNHPEADPNNLPSFFISAMELSPEAHADVQCIIQKHVDSSLSKTVNAPRGYSVAQVAKVYERLYKGGAKGGTVYVDGSREEQVLSLTNEENSFDNIEEVGTKKAIEQIEEVTSKIHDHNHEEVDEENIGVEVGQTCPMCRKGKVEKLGGCHTCTNCKAQLVCGL